MRGETCVGGSIPACFMISIHSPHARGDASITDSYMRLCISIHSPHARGDGICPARHTHAKNFNPLPSCEGRPSRLLARRCPTDFNPLPSCEGRLKLKMSGSQTKNFNPLPSCEGRRRRTAVCGLLRLISIHSPHARGDLRRHLPDAGGQHFNPLPSCEGRHILFTGACGS